MRNFVPVFEITMKGFVRDRLLKLLLGIALLFFLAIPALSIFSMRQVQELSITLSLSAISLILVVLTVILGSSSIWRDTDRRYLTSVLGLPVSRTSYLLGKFSGIAAFILGGSIILGLAATMDIAIVSSRYPSELPVRWLHIWLAIVSDGMKCVLVAAIAMFFSSISSSFYFPFLATLTIYFCGSASQSVYEYVMGDVAKNLSALSHNIIVAVYYLLPNFSAFDFKIQAVYAVPVSYKGLAYTTAYFIIYTAIVLVVSLWAFNRRELA